MYGLITYRKHVFAAYNLDIDPRDDLFHPFTPDEWSQQSSTMLRSYLIQNLPRATSQHFRLCIVEMHSRKLRHDDTSAKNVTQYVRYALAFQR